MQSGLSLKSQLSGGGDYYCYTGQSINQSAGSDLKINEKHC